MDDDITLSRDRSPYILGRAKIPLAAFDFERPIHINEINEVDKLREVFTTEGCCCLDPWNQVPVTVKRDEVSRQLQASRHDINDLMNETKPPLGSYIKPKVACHVAIKALVILIIIS